MDIHGVAPLLQVFDMPTSIRFYRDVLGLTVGFRPKLDFPGYWLYSGGTATVHLMGTRKARA